MTEFAPGEMPTIETERLVLRPAQEADLPEMLRIVTAPGAAEWWGEYEGASDDKELLNGWAITLDGAVIGWLGSEEETDAKYRSVGLDIMIDPAHHKQGFGPETLRGAIDWYAKERSHHRFTIDPSAANAHAIKAYEKVGYQRIGVARQYCELQSGERTDGLLMDLLVEELA